MQSLRFQRSFLQTLWKLWLFALFPLVIWLYCFVTGVDFNLVDEGSNYHKWIIFVIYVACLVAWFVVNRTLNHRSFFRNQ